MVNKVEKLPLGTLQSVLYPSEPAGAPVHYGLFEGDRAQGRALPEAQKLFSEMVLEKALSVTEIGDEVLLLGPSLGLVSKGLSEADRKVRFPFSDKGCDGKETPSSNWSAEEGGQRYKIAIVEGSIHYLDQLQLFRSLAEALQLNGMLFLFGEFLVDDSAIQHSTLPNLSSLAQLSERLGFENTLHLDLSQHALMSLNWLVQHLPDFEIPSQELMAITAALESIISNFKVGRRCFQFSEFAFKPDNISNFPDAQFLSNGEFVAQDISNVFEASFGEAFNEDLWRWKYLLGDGKSIAVRESKSGPIVAHYGGAPRDIYYFGKPSKAIQVCDVMALPSVRRHYGKGSVFFKAAATFLEREIGNTVNHLLGFGFPNQKAMNIAIRLGLYEKTDDFVELLIPPQGEKSGEEFEFTAIDQENPKHQQQIDCLWEIMREEHNNHIIGVRDWAYIKYRYFDHPIGVDGGYKRWLLHDANHECVAAVFVREHGGANLIMDILCQAEKLESVVLELSNSESVSTSSQALKFWITKGQLSTLQLSGVVEQSLGIEIPCNSWNPGPSAETLYGAWWLTAGDMDFL